MRTYDQYLHLEKATLIDSLVQQRLFKIQNNQVKADADCFYLDI